MVSPEKQVDRDVFILKLIRPKKKSKFSQSFFGKKTKLGQKGTRVPFFPRSWRKPQVSPRDVVGNEKCPHKNENQDTFVQIDFFFIRDLYFSSQSVMILKFRGCFFSYFQNPGKKILAHTVYSRDKSKLAALPPPLSPKPQKMRDLVYIK